MAVNYQDYARRLNVIDVWAQGNPTGYVTNSILYTPNPTGHPDIPLWEGPSGGIIHGTQGSNSLPYLTGGSIADGRYVSAHYLLPKDTYTVYKLIPEGHACWHAGVSEWLGLDSLNRFFYGFEVENRQNGTDPFTESQYIKLALIWGYLSARDRLLDINLVSHARVAIPLGRKSDPDAGKFSYSKFYAHLIELRRPQNWPTIWGLQRWNGCPPE